MTTVFSVIGLLAVIAGVAWAWGKAHGNKK